MEEVHSSVGPVEASGTKIVFHNPDQHPYQAVLSSIAVVA